MPGCVSPSRDVTEATLDGWAIAVPSHVEMPHVSEGLESATEIPGAVHDRFRDRFSSSQEMSVCQGENDSLGGTVGSVHTGNSKQKKSLWCWRGTRHS